MRSGAACCARAGDDRMMAPSRSHLAACVVLLCVTAGCGEEQLNAPAVSATPTTTRAAFCKADAAEVEARVDALLSQMTVAEKIDQMHGSSPIPANGLFITPDNARLAIPGFAMVDGPRGVAWYAGNATAFPVGIARGATWDPDLEARIGATIGEELRAKGGSVLLAPVTAIVRHP